MRISNFLKSYKSIILSISALLILTSACNYSNQSYESKSVPISSISPWDISLDSSYVLQNPDRFAWDLFRAINWPADTTKMTADTIRQLGDSGMVVWQTWKTGPEVYRANGHKPEGWFQKDFGMKSTKNFQQFSKKAKMPDITKNPTFGLEEVVLNKSTFDYVVENYL